MNPMMKCGHSAQGKNSKGEPCCITCLGILAGAEQIDESPPDLSGRKARCLYCKFEQSSDPSLAFFRHWKEQENDEFYCGCRGWD